MLRSNGVSRSAEQVFNLLYNVGFRLTGDHNKTTNLVIDAFRMFKGHSQQDTKIALKCLCETFINKQSSVDKKILVNRHNSNAIGGKQVQEALLLLAPIERLLLVLRDVLGLEYDDIANLIGHEKEEVSGVIAEGRRSLHKLLNPVMLCNKQRRISVAK